MSRRRQPSAAARYGLKFEFANLARASRPTDSGSISLTRVGADEGDDHIDTQGDADACIAHADLYAGHSQSATLHIPGGILYAMPEAGEIAYTLRPRMFGGPGVPLMLYGSGGNADRWPSWAREKQGLYTWRTLRLEARDEAVEIQSGDDDDIVLNAGTRKVARVDDTVDVGTLAVAYAAPSGVGTVTFTFTPADGGTAIVFAIVGAITAPALPALIRLTGKITSGADRVKA
jgi:hypothetical protein